MMSASGSPFADGGLVLQRASGREQKVTLFEFEELRRAVNP